MLQQGVRVSYIASWPPRRECYYTRGKPLPASLNDHKYTRVTLPASRKFATKNVRTRENVIFSHQLCSQMTAAARLAAV